MHLIKENFDKKISPTQGLQGLFPSFDCQRPESPRDQIKPPPKLPEDK